MVIRCHSWSLVCTFGHDRLQCIQTRWPWCFKHSHWFSISEYWTLYILPREWTLPLQNWSKIQKRAFQIIFHIHSYNDALSLSRLVLSPEVNPDSSPTVQSPVYVYTGHRTLVGNRFPRPTYIHLSYDCDLWKYQKCLVFLLHLALFRLVGLSKRKIIEPSLTAFTGFPFALVFTCTFSECV